VVVGLTNEEDAAGRRGGAENPDTLQTGEGRRVVLLVQIGLHSPQSIRGHVARVGEEIVGVGVVAVAGIGRKADSSGRDVRDGTVVEGDLVHRGNILGELC